jgi:hypothetical protein
MRRCSQFFVTVSCNCLEKLQSILVSASPFPRTNGLKTRQAVRHLIFRNFLLRSPPPGTHRCVLLRSGQAPSYKSVSKKPPGQTGSKSHLSAVCTMERSCLPSQGRAMSRSRGNAAAHVFLDGSPGAERIGGKRHS